MATVILVSSDANGVIGNALSRSRSISSDGRYVVFESDATSLVTNDSNGLADVFVKDTLTGTITRVSTDVGGVQANGFSFGGDVTADGRYVAFQSDATNLVTNDSNGLADVFVKDIQTGAVTRISTNSAGQESTGGSIGSWAETSSADGRYVLICSDATNLVANDLNGTFDLFLKDTVTGTMSLVSADANGLQANSGAFTAFRAGLTRVTDDGRYVFFESDATNLVAGDTNNMVDVFKKDMLTGAITRVSTDAAGNQATGGADFALTGLANVRINGISSDGRYVAFENDAANLVAGDTNGVVDIFMKDTLTGAITRVNTDAAGNEAVGGGSATSGRSVSADGRYVVFYSTATNLASGDTNGVQDIFIKDTLTGTIARVNLDSADGQAVGGDSGGSRISADGSMIAFNTSATNLVAGDTNGAQDVVAVANPFMLTGITVTGDSTNNTLAGSIGIDTFNIASGTVTLTDAVPGTDIINISSGATAVQNLTTAIASYAANTTNSGTLVIYALPSTASTITGSSGIDIITGSSAGDILDGGAGNDTLDGGAGIDSASYTGNRAGFTVTQTSTGFTVTDSLGTEGTDTVTNIERLQFADTKLALDLDGNAGTTAKILGAVFGTSSLANTTYVGIGLTYLDGGMSYTDLMQLAIDAYLGPGASHTAVVNLLYTNVVGVAPSTADRDYFVGLLDTGAYTVASLGVMAADHSLNVANINLTGLPQSLAQMGIEFI